MPHRYNLPEIEEGYAHFFQKALENKEDHLPYYEIQPWDQKLGPIELEVFREIWGTGLRLYTENGSCLNPKGGQSILFPVSAAISRSGNSSKAGVPGTMLNLKTFRIFINFNSLRNFIGKTSPAYWST